MPSFKSGWYYGADYNFSFHWDDLRSGNLAENLGYLCAHACRVLKLYKILGWV